MIRAQATSSSTAVASSGHGLAGRAGWLHDGGKASLLWSRPRRFAEGPHVWPAAHQGPAASCLGRISVSSFQRRGMVFQSTCFLSTVFARTEEKRLFLLTVAYLFSRGLQAPCSDTAPQKGMPASASWLLVTGGLAMCVRKPTAGITFAHTQRCAGSALRDVSAAGV